MPQIKKTLWMVYHERPDGTSCLARNPETAFGYINAEPAFILCSRLERNIQGFKAKIRQEDLLIDPRFPFEIDPEYVDIAYNADRFQLPLLQ